MTQNEQSAATTIAILGGTGKEGSALAVRWALNGFQVILGSRDAARAQERAAELNAEFAASGLSLSGMGNPEAANAAQIVVISVPYTAHQATLESVKLALTGKILVDITVPAVPPNVHIVHLPEGKSAALEAQALLGEQVRVVSAFQNVSATKIKNPHNVVDCDVLICSDDADAKVEVIKLAEAAGMRGIDAGPLANAIAAEALTSVLVYIGKTYKARGAGLRITGLP